MKIFFLSFLHICLVHFGWAQQKQFPPKDETNLDSSLSAFVQDLRKAIITKDDKWITSVLDDEVRGSFDDEGGIISIVNEWDIDNDSSIFWHYLSRVIDMGGVFLHDEADQTGKYQFVFPYTYAIEPGLEDDYFNLGVITGKNVNLRDAPSTDSKVKDQLTYNVIWFVTDRESGIQTTSGSNEHGLPEWYRVETYDRSQGGWVNWRYVYSLMGPRLFLFRSVTGQWKISAFVEGD